MPGVDRFDKSTDLTDSTPRGPRAARLDGVAVGDVLYYSCTTSSGPVPTAVRTNDVSLKHNSLVRVDHCALNLLIVTAVPCSTVGGTCSVWDMRSRMSRHVGHHVHESRSPYWLGRFRVGATRAGSASRAPSGRAGGLRQTGAATASRSQCSSPQQSSAQMSRMRSVVRLEPRHALRMHRAASGW